MWVGKLYDNDGDINEDQQKQLLIAAVAPALATFTASQSGGSKLEFRYVFKGSRWDFNWY